MKHQDQFYSNKGEQDERQWIANSGDLGVEDPWILSRLR